jgi:hypothetical protein
LLLLLAVVASLASGCASSRRPELTPSGAAEQDAARGPDAGTATAASPAALPPWEVPPDALGTQTLYRVTVTGAEGEGSLKLTLRLAAAGRYQVQAVDPLGRGLWSLDVEGDRGLWLDHRARLVCRLDGALDLDFLPLGPLSLAALPPLLLNRLPLPPAVPEAVTRRAVAGAGAAGAASGGGAEEVAYGDAAGRRWTGVLRGGRLQSWALAQNDGGEPILSWVSSGGWSVLSDRRRGVQVRWRQAVREPLRQLAPLAVPPDYGAGRCARGGGAAH